MKRRENTMAPFRDQSHEPTGPSSVSDFSSNPPSPATDCDVLIVGGGINGCGIARDLAGRGWRVVLCEKDDLASHTSSSSTKLIHGGLRYLEYYEFSLVRKALQEREVLLKSAPHIMWPLRFVMPHDLSMRPAWMIRIGLFLYDHLAKREVLPGSRSIDLRSHAAGAPLKPQFKRGFVYSDGWVDDARLVVLNAIDARARGAEVLTRTRCVHAQRDADGWTATLEAADGGVRTVRARAVVNAAGPWAESFLRGVAQSAKGEPLATRHLRLVKGSHIVVPRLFEHDHAYIFQNPDKRIIFAIPYQDEFTLIGTTDIELNGDDPGAARIAEEEIAYLCMQASRYFDKPVKPADVVWTYSGVRPLLDDASGDPRPSRATTCSSRTPPRHRCCRCGAARSPPSASWPRTRPTRSARCSASRARSVRPGPMAPSWPAAIFPHGSAPPRGPTTISNASWPRCRRAMHGWTPSSRVAWHVPTARAWPSCSATPSPWKTWAKPWHPASTSASCASCKRTSGP